MEELLFYAEYESFYDMANHSDAFRKDFSQDGFSDIRQTDRILDYVPMANDLSILDVGCGNTLKEYEEIK